MSAFISVNQRFHSLLLLTLLISCGAPFFERAIDPPGTSAGLGAGISAGYLLDQPSSYFAAGVTAYGRRSLSSNLSASLEVAGWAFRPESLGYVGSLQGAVKFRALPEGATKLSFGAAFDFFAHGTHSRDWAPLLSLSYLHDFTESATAIATVGVPTGLGIGLGLHPRLTPRLIGHFSAIVRWWSVLSASVGFAVEPAPPLPPWEQPRESL